MGAIPERERDSGERKSYGMYAKDTLKPPFCCYRHCLANVSLPNTRTQKTHLNIGEWRERDKEKREQERENVIDRRRYVNVLMMGWKMMREMSKRNHDIEGR